MKILELSLMCSFNSIQYCFTTQGRQATINAMGFRISPPKVVQRPARPQTVRRCFGFFSVLYILQYYSLIWNFQYYSLICNFSQNVAMAAARGATFWPVLTLGCTWEVPDTLPKHPKKCSKVDPLLIDNRHHNCNHIRPRLANKYI